MASSAVTMAVPLSRPEQQSYRCGGHECSKTLSYTTNRDQTFPEGLPYLKDIGRNPLNII